MRHLSSFWARWVKRHLKVCKMFKDIVKEVSKVDKANKLEIKYLWYN